MVVVAKGRRWCSTKRRSRPGSRMRMAEAPITASGRAAPAIRRAAAAGASASGAGAGVRPGTDVGAASRAGISATSSGRSRWTGPGGSARAVSIAASSVGTILPSLSARLALVIGANRAWWSIAICMRRPMRSASRLQVTASIGERSSQAQPTPVARLVAPGPRVAMHRPGRPLRRPVTSAQNAAEPSCAVSTKSMPPARIASISGSTLPLGTPKPWPMPAAPSVATMRSALFTRRTPRGAGT